VVRVVNIQLQACKLQACKLHDEEVRRSNVIVFVTVYVLKVCAHKHTKLCVSTLRFGCPVDSFMAPLIDKSFLGSFTRSFFLVIGKF
jgi:hypothetical protein